MPIGFAVELETHIQPIFRGLQAAAVDGDLAADLGIPAHRRFGGRGNFGNGRSALQLHLAGRHADAAQTVAVEQDAAVFFFDDASDKTLAIGAEQDIGVCGGLKRQQHQQGRGDGTKTWIHGRKSRKRCPDSSAPMPMAEVALPVPEKLNYRNAITASLPGGRMPLHALDQGHMRNCQCRQSDEHGLHDGGRKP